MKGLELLLLGAFALLNVASTPSWAVDGEASADPTTLLESFARIPLHFEANQGLANSKVQFLARGPGYGFYLTPDEFVISLPPRKAFALSSHPGHETPPSSSPLQASVVRMALVGANKKAAPTAEAPLPGRSNYFVGNDRSQWRTNVPQYARVRYAHVYPGIDLVFYGNQRQLEYDFVLKPGADPGHIRLRFKGVQAVRVDDAGNLTLRTVAGDLLQKAPVVYQEIEGQRRTVAGRYVVEGHRAVRFEVASYDRTAALVIDPVLVYSTYLGGSGSEQTASAAVDAAGAVYIAGTTSSTDFPTVNPYQPAAGSGVYDAFVAKLDPSGSALVYATYLGGSANDRALSVAVDGSGNAYVVGNTASVNFPTANAFQGSKNPGTEAFVTKLSPSGSSLVFSTYFGGAGLDSATRVALDGAGSVYVVGGSDSTVIPGVSTSLFSNTPGTCGAAPDTFPCTDAFLLKLNAAGTVVNYFTYLGGAGEDLALAVAVDASGSAYVGGYSASTNFPLQNALQPVFGGGLSDGFAAKLNPQGTALVFSTYLGGSGASPEIAEIVNGFVLDGPGNLYLAGATDSANFPTTASAFQRTFGGGATDGFAAKMNASGSQLVYATLLGGSDADATGSPQVDAAGNAYLAGSTSSANFPVLNPTQSYAGGSDAYVTKLSPDGSTLLFSTTFGGSGLDGGGVRIDGAGNIYLIGGTASSDFPTKNAFDAALGGSQDVFVAKLVEPLKLFTVAPCRALDTREPDGPLAGPALFPSQQRTFALAGICGIPVTAKALSVNLTVVGPTAPGFVTLFPGDASLPSTSSINFLPAQVRANSGIFRLASDGSGRLSAFNGSAGSTHILIDVNGYLE